IDWSVSILSSAGAAVNLATLPQLARHADRVREIMTILGKYGLADWVSRIGWSFPKRLLKGQDGKALAILTHEARIRLALPERGTTFIKSGQMLSPRADLVGQDLAEELTLLQASAPADPPVVVRDIIAKEFSKPIEELFSQFDLQPIASGSIGQVHRA